MIFLSDKLGEVPMSTNVNANEPLSPQDWTRGLAEGGTIPAATAHHSVLIEPGGAIPLTAPAPAAYTLRGSTTDFNVSYDTTLGSAGQALADAILGRCEQDLSQFRSFFGGVSAGRFSVFIDPGTFGAYHAGCAATEIHCAV